MERLEVDEWDWDLDPYLVDRYAVPRRLTGRAWRGGTCIEIDIEISEGKARARKVSVTSDQPKGVGSGTLRAVPVREAMVAMLSITVGRAVHVDDKTLQIVRDDSDVEERARIVRQLVGYVEVEP